jgi:hypothetical protein
MDFTTGRHGARYRGPCPAEAILDGILALSGH